MKGLRNALLALLGVFTAPVLIWVGAGVALYQDSTSRSLLQRPARRSFAGDGLTCALDADCPPGYICMNGSCVPATEPLNFR